MTSPSSSLGEIPPLNTGTLEYDHEIYIDENTKRNKIAMPEQTFTFKNEMSAEAEEQKRVEQEEKKERELAETIDRFLRTLPERECSMFLRRCWYVDSVQSIAARYAIKENTAKSILFRTREKLRRYLAGEGIIV